MKCKTKKCKKRKNWKTFFIILAIATLIDLIVPDPVPFVDEIMLIAVSIWTGVKYFS